MTCTQVIEEGGCSLHDAIIIVQRTFENSIVVGSDGAIDVSNLLY
jgi:hypothetical protein